MPSIISRLPRRASSRPRLRDWVAAAPLVLQRTAAGAGGVAANVVADGVADRGGSGLGWLLYLGEAEVLVDFLDGRLEEDRGALLTVLGRAQITRPYYLCGQCHHGQFPADGQLDLDGTELSPGVRRMLAVVGAAAPFDRGRQQMEVLAGLRITAKAVERTAEAIGCDIAQREQREIQRAVQLDLPMVMGEPIPILYVQMDGTGVPVVKQETAGRKGKTEVIDKLRTEASYFERNAARMRYPDFRRQHLFVGSGVIEAGCKTVIGSRLKQSGMFWTLRGANSIIALRCCQLNGRFESYWKARAA